MESIPTIPRTLRTWCYATGALLGLGAAPALIAFDLPAAAAAAGAIAGAFNALAFGYRPTRPDAT